MDPQADLDHGDSWPPHTDAEARRLIAAARGESSLREASLYISVKHGRARIAYPDGAFEILKEGEAVRIWPHYLRSPHPLPYHSRPEPSR